VILRLSGQKRVSRYLRGEHKPLISSSAEKPQEPVTGSRNPPARMTTARVATGDRSGQPIRLSVLWERAHPLASSLSSSP
jgi:hypothetical protein